MIPRDFIYKHLFVFLYKFAHGSILLYIVMFYIATLLFFRVNEPYIVFFFIAAVLLLFFQQVEINDNLKKQFDRYKKYLILKRKRKSKKLKEQK